MNIEELLSKAQDGNEDAINELIKMYFPLVSINAKNFFIVGAEKEDLVQEGLLGLLKAIKSYDSKKSSFNTFAIICVRRQIFSAIKSANRQKNLALNEAILNSSNNEDNNFDLELISTDNSPENIYFNHEKLKNFQKYTEEKLSKLEKQVFEYLIRGYSYKEIAEILNTNSKSIDNAIQRIKRKSEIWINKYNLN